MNDLISRQAAIEAVGDVHPLDYNGQAILYRIKALPTADPVKWIPTSRELPRFGQRVLTPTFWGTVTIGYLRQVGKEQRVEWRIADDRHFGRYIAEPLDTPIAWMPLPEPWRGEEG